jgi:hypothetical protein
MQSWRKRTKARRFATSQTPQLRGLRQPAATCLVSPGHCYFFVSSVLGGVEGFACPLRAPRSSVL